MEPLASPAVVAAEAATTTTAIVPPQPSVEDQIAALPPPPKRQRAKRKRSSSKSKKKKSKTDDAKEGKKKYRRFIFVKQNYTDEDRAYYESLGPTEKLVFLMYGRELSKGEVTEANPEGIPTPHLQGYIVFPNPRSFQSVVKLMRCHIETCEGNNQQNYNYCSKEDDKPFIYGTLPPDMKGKGKESGTRSDIRVFEDNVKAMAESGVWDLPKLIDENLEIYAKFEKHFYRRVRYWAPKKPPPTGEPRGFQRQVLADLETPPDDRTVIFVVDPKGNGGKTWLSDYFASKYPGRSILVCPGKKADMAFLLAESYTPNVNVFLIDAPRSKQGDFLQYDLLEHLKDGRIVSMKYNSTIISIPVPHVVVFMNEEPDYSKLSYDRYKVYIKSTKDDEVVERDENGYELYKVLSGDDIEIIQHEKDRKANLQVVAKRLRAGQVLDKLEELFTVTTYRKKRAKVFDGYERDM